MNGVDERVNGEDVRVNGEDVRVNGEDLYGRRQKAGGQIIRYEKSPFWSMEVVLLRRRDGDDVLDGLFGREDCLFQRGASFLGE